MALLLVQAGADTRLMDSEERTADMVSSQSEEAICDSSDQSEAFYDRNECFQVARQYGHHMVADIINSPRDKYRYRSCTKHHIASLYSSHRPTFPTQFMEFLKASAGDEACVILWDEHLE